jgi:hypothetical protein
VATGCRNYSIEELSKLLTERLHGPWHLLFVNSAWWLWYRNYKQTMSATIVASSPNWKDRAAARFARCVARDIGSTYCLANVAICWPAKTVDATDYRPFNRDIIIHIDIMHGKGRHGDERRTLVVAHFTLIFLRNEPFQHLAIPSVTLQ